jgi:glutaminyl-tRNA synthetase
MNSIALCANSKLAKVLKGIKSGALNSLQTITAYVELALVRAKPYDKFLFERHGYFVANRVDHKQEKVVFTRVAGLKDNWAK